MLRSSTYILMHLDFRGVIYLTLHVDSKSVHGVSLVVCIVLIVHRVSYFMLMSVQGI